MKRMKLSDLTSFLIVSFLLNSVLVTSQEVEDEKEFSYIKGSENGPDHWGEIHEEWAACGNGNMQSPIDLLDERVEVVHHSGKLDTNYKSSNATLINRGHDIMIKWAEGAGSIYVDKTEFFLKQVHWHSPSEHTVNGRRYLMEAHMVHESLDGKIAVVGIIFKIGQPNPFLTKLKGHLKIISDRKNAEEVVGFVDPSDMKLGTKNYYRYKGSLTTPPCTEGVIWIILKQGRTVSEGQLGLLREAVHDDSKVNARPTQATNLRTVDFYIQRGINF